MRRHCSAHHAIALIASILLLLALRRSRAFACAFAFAFTFAQCPTHKIVICCARSWLRASRGRGCHQPHCSNCRRPSWRLSRLSLLLPACCNHRCWAAPKTLSSFSSVSNMYVQNDRQFGLVCLLAHHSLFTKLQQDEDGACQEMDGWPSLPVAELRGH